MQTCDLARAKAVTSSLGQGARTPSKYSKPLLHEAAVAPAQRWEPTNLDFEARSRLSF